MEFWSHTPVRSISSFGISWLVCSVRQILFPTCSCSWISWCVPTLAMLFSVPCFNSTQLGSAVLCVRCSARRRPVLFLPPSTPPLPNLRPQSRPSLKESSGFMRIWHSIKAERIRGTSLTHFTCSFFSKPCLTDEIEPVILKQNELRTKTVYFCPLSRFQMDPQHICLSWFFTRFKIFLSTIYLIIYGDKNNFILWS